jgi:hypothetical protein
VLNRSLPLVICHLSFGASVVADSGLTAPIQPRIISITTSKIAALTGPQALTDQKGVDICGTDLGIVTELNDRIYFACYSQNAAARCRSAPAGSFNAASNVMD